MAKTKKIDIEGQNLLTNITQPWGGVNNGESAIPVYGTQVPAGYEWGVNRGEVERFMKEQYGTKVGDFRTTDPDENNFIHLLCFATKADAAAWDEDPEAGYLLVLKDLTMPISTIQQDSYTAQLYTSLNSTVQYLVKDGASFVVPLRFNATHVIAATSSTEYMSGNGTLIVERMQNSQWQQVATQTIAASTETTGFPSEVDLKGLLQSGSVNQVRLRTSFAYTDFEGTDKVMVSTPIVLNINSVTLSLEMTTPWQEPQIDPAALHLAYTVRGTVARTIHLKVKGSAGTYETTHTLTPAQTQDTFSLVEMSAYGLLTHGIKTTEAWLTAGDSQVGELESDHLIVRVMVVKTSVGPEIYMQPKLLISEMREKVENFVQTRLLSYAVYSPSINGDGDLVNDGPAVPTTFLLTNNASSIVSVEQTVYTSVLVNPSPSNKYFLDVTVEIEQDGDTLPSFLHATREEGSVTKDFLYESIGEGSIYLPIDNTAGFQPTAGSNFLLNPKTRNNSEDNPMVIINQKTGGIINSTWENFRFGNEDGWVKDSNGESCLRVPAGRRLTIFYNALAILRRSPNASLTIEFDVAMRNVTNEDDIILQLAEIVSGQYRGLRMQPTVGYFTTESWNADEECDFRWQEDVRTHFAINIVNAVYPNEHNDALITPEKQSQAAGSIPLVRVFINGKINREIVYTPSATEFGTGENDGIIIGQDGADIDIYGIRCFENQALTAENVHQDYKSTIPDSAKKRELNYENGIIDPNTGLIGVKYITGDGSIAGIKKNVLIWHGAEPYHEDSHEGERGWLEIFRYDRNGNYLPELSGTICQATKSVPQKPQGTTAKTYYYYNIQWDLHKATGFITILVSMLHSSITAVWDADYVWTDSDDEPTGEVGAWMIKGGYLGKNFPLPSESPLPYHGTETSVTVPDGWIDGNGKYRGVGYQVAEGIPMAQKTVNKINYASSMQSHLPAINWLYNELHTAICGKNTMQTAVSGAVVAKHTEPFLFFTQAEGSDRAVFRGPCAYGAGKMDKPSWGYVKSAHPDFCMIEGADNDKPLTDMRVPFDDEAHGNGPAKVFYDPDEEAYYYRVAGGTTEKCIDFDGGATTKMDGKEYPKASIVSYIKAAWNFLYLHAPRIRHYNGTLQDFYVDAELAERPITPETTPEERERIAEAQARVNKANKYWCHLNGTNAGDYLLKRYDYTDGEWVDAGLWDGTQYAQIDLRTYSMTAAAWNALTEAEKYQDDVVNNAFVLAVVADARNHIGEYFKESSIKFHYAFQNHFVAGTDNCSKNTYYVLDPSTHLFELHQDDVDTTLATDNSGLQSKPYYIDRMHPYGGALADRTAMTADVENGILYEGYYNVLFDLCELMYEPTGDLAAMLRTILSTMASLTGGIGSSESDAMSGVWKSLNRYIFDVQRYFPAVVYNEAARIRYELPELIGFLSDIRSIHPIKQSLGDQLQSELQFMKRRLVYMASYCAFGEFTPTSLRQGLTGLAEATDSFGMQKFPLPGSSSPSAYVFHLVPHQWLYPTGGRETSNLINPHVRVAPGATNMPDGYFELSIDPGQASDLGINVFGLNYYRELGNVGDMVANNGQANFTLNGRRLTKFEAVPTVFYTEENLPAFRVNNIIIGTATRLQEFNVKGAVIGTGTLNLSALTLCQNIDLRETKISQVRIPETATLTTLRLPALLTAVSLTAQPSLSTLSFEGYSRMTQMAITNSPLLGTATRGYVATMYSQGVNITSLSLAYISWLTMPIETALMRWMLAIGDSGQCFLAGAIAMAAGNAGLLSYNDVARLIARYGDIRNNENGLYVSFISTTIPETGASVDGNRYINTNPASAGYDLDENQNYEGISLNVNTGNDVAVAVKQDGTLTPDVVWDVTDDVQGVYATFPDPYSPVLHVVQTGAAVRGIRVTVRATLTNINGFSHEYTATIGLWNRVPEVGDFAWADGTFNKEDEPAKKMVGCVIMREPLEYDEFNNITKCKLWVYSAKDPIIPDSSDGSSASYAETYKRSWGIYPNASNGFSNATGDSADKLIAAIRVATGLSNPFDTPLPNSGGSRLLVSPSTYQKEDNGVPITGYKDSADNQYAISGIIGDGVGYLQLGDHVGFLDFAAKSRNKTLLDYANIILGVVLSFNEDGFYIDSNDLPEDVDENGVPLTTQALADVMQLIVKAAENAGMTNPIRYRELLFPAARLCSVWSPSDEPTLSLTEEELDPQYRRGNWLLPTTGFLGRVMNFLNNSRVTINDGSQPSISKANEDPTLKESQLPLFSNMLARSDSRRSIELQCGYGAHYWATCEINNTGSKTGLWFYNGEFFNVYGQQESAAYQNRIARPVVPFTFIA